MKSFILSLWGCSLCGWMNPDEASFCGHCKVSK